MNYEQLVKEGQALIKLTVAQGDRLEMGRLALLACGPPRADKNRGGGTTELGSFQSLSKFAHDLGFPQQTLSDYREIAFKWENEEVSDEAPWSVLKLLADHEDKQNVLANSRDEFGKITAKAVKKFLNVSDELAEEEKEDEEEETFPVVNEGCPIPVLTLERFEEVLYQSLELWPGFTQQLRPTLIKQFIAEDKRPEDCRLTKESVLQDLTTIKKYLDNYIKEMRNEL